ncbi:MAG: HAD family hydrolase [Tenericutes bacterium HGW-Tenericutes-3]|nr:MAG: HAD family hydrolase [Tenericutes bacterium HGW-Tenericutes-3]
MEGNMITTILFDLDGTLLPLNDNEFLRLYFGLMAKYFNELGYDGSAITKAVLEGTEAMYSNDGSMTNEIAFWIRFKQHFNTINPQLETEFERFYEKEFEKVKASTMTHPLSNKIIQILKDKGYTIALATNPLFPPIATKKRIEWAGMNPSDFAFVTTYDNSSWTKPHQEYYQFVLNQIHKIPCECMMIGNDASEDMAAEKLGISTYLLTHNLINSKNKDIQKYRHGDFEDLYQMILELPNIK